jgi:hypothetical protein
MIELGCRFGLGAKAMRSGAASRVYAVQVDKESTQPVDVFGVPVERLLAVGNIAGLDSQQIGCNDPVKRVVRRRGVVGRRHEWFLPL